MEGEELVEFNVYYKMEDVNLCAAGAISSLLYYGGVQLEDALRNASAFLGDAEIEMADSSDDEEDDEGEYLAVDPHKVVAATKDMDLRAIEGKLVGADAVATAKSAAAKAESILLQATAGGAGAGRGGSGGGDRSMAAHRGEEEEEEEEGGGGGGGGGGSSRAKGASGTSAAAAGGAEGASGASAAAAGGAGARGGGGSKLAARRAGSPFAFMGASGGKVKRPAALLVPCFTRGGLNPDFTKPTETFTGEMREALWAAFGKKFNVDGHVL
jgi:hypothetical protein